MPGVELSGGLTREVETMSEDDSPLTAAISAHKRACEIYAAATLISRGHG
jgi:hypothetical protein